MRYRDETQREIIAPDGRVIPVNPENRDYQDLVANGTVISPSLVVITSEMVNEVRDRKMSRFPYNGKIFQFDTDSQTNVAGAGTLALAAIMQGAQPGDFMWAGGNTPFVWLAEDNTAVQMDAQQTLQFAQAAAQWKRLHIYAARAIKDQGVEDIENSQLWPAGA